MILQKTNAYSFVCGNSHKALLKNNIKNRYEVWLKGEPGKNDNIVWCWFEIITWLTFSHVASEAEIRKFHTI